MHTTSVYNKQTSANVDHKLRKATFMSIQLTIDDLQHNTVHFILE